MCYFWFDFKFVRALYTTEIKTGISSLVGSRINDFFFFLFALFCCWYFFVLFLSRSYFLIFVFVWNSLVFHYLPSIGYFPFILCNNQRIRTKYLSKCYRNYCIKTWTHFILGAWWLIILLPYCSNSTSHRTSASIFFSLPFNWSFVAALFGYLQ